MSMDFRQYEGVIQLHTAEQDLIVKHVRDQLLVGFRDSAQPIRFTLSACCSDNIAGSLPVSEKLLDSCKGLSEEQLSLSQYQIINRASRGSIAITVLEELFVDPAFENRTLCLHGFAELLDVHENDVIDRYGCRWKVSPLFDEFQLSTRNWKRITAVTLVAGETTTTSESSAAYLIALSIRGIFASTYASLCSWDSLAGESWVQLIVLLARTILEASTALVSISFIHKEKLSEGHVIIQLPCGTDIILEVPCKQRVCFNHHLGGALSPMAIYAINVSSVILMGSGYEVSSNIETESEAGAVDAHVAHVLWSLAAFVCSSFLEKDSNTPRNDMIRYLTICLLAMKKSKFLESSLSDDDQYKSREHEDLEFATLERVHLAKAELDDLAEEIGMDLSIYFSSEDSEDVERSSITASPVTGSSCSISDVINREEFLHYGVGSSDLPVLETDYVSEDGISVCARRGIPIKPDTRRTVVIRKKKALWGRVSFVDGAFVWKGLISAAGVLRALIPVQSVTVGFIGVQQFESSPGVQGDSGSEIANLLLSGTYGADAALWALKKILYSGAGVKEGHVTSYLSPMRGHIDADGWQVVSLLGKPAVQAMEVIVDTRGRVLLDYEGNYKPLQLSLGGRRLEAVEIEDDYEGGRVGTIANSVCLF